MSNLTTSLSSTPTTPSIANPFNSIDWKALLAQMLTASADVVKNDWPQVVPYAEHEYAGYLSDLQFIHSMLSQGQIDKDTATALLEMHQNSIKVVFFTIKGIGILIVEQAINAAFAVLSSTINTALGFVLI